MSWCSQVAGGVRLAVLVQPNAKKTEVIGVQDDAGTDGAGKDGAVKTGTINQVLKIRLHAPALEGRANEALIRFLADSLKLPKSAITLTHGQTSRRKLLEVRASGLTLAQLGKALWPSAE